MSASLFEVQRKKKSGTERKAFSFLKKLFIDVRSNINQLDSDFRQRAAEHDLAFQKELFSLIDQDEIIDCIKNFLKYSDLSLAISSLEQIENNEFSFIVPLFFNENKYFLTSALNLKEISLEQKISLSLMLATMKDFNSLFHQRPENQELVFWKDVFSKLCDPVALFNENSELIAYNNDFIKLNLLSDYCLSLSHNEIIAIDEKYFRVYKREVLHGRLPLVLIVFLQSHSEEKNISNFALSSKELGIITSSLAHEINNPIAGIMAALSYLRLDVPEKLIDDIEEMFNTADRCKELVEVFLGFSRYIPGEGRETSGLRSPFDHSLSLLRFRLIENNMNLSMEYIAESSYLHTIHRPIFTMVIYLLMGEALTAYHHFLLIADKDKDRSIKGRAIEKENSFELIFSTDFFLNRQLETSNLVHYMLRYLSMELDIVHNKIILSSVKPL